MVLKKSKKTDLAGGLTFRQLRSANVKRCNEYFHSLESWTYTDWATALSGEVGELCNFIKKMRRGEKISIKKLAKECGDIQCYLDLLSARLGIDLEQAVRQKFNEVSGRKNCKIKL